MKKRDVSLDLLRIIAVAMVFMVHLSQRAFFPYVIKYICSFGGRGVQIFYVLSAYLCMASFEKCKSIKEFYIKRINRIVPMFWCGLLLIIIAHVALAWEVPADCTHLYWSRYLLFINSIVPSNDVFWTNLYGFWTMGAFVLFYLLTPAIKRFADGFYKSFALFIAFFGFQFIQGIIYRKLFLNCAAIAPEKLNEFIGFTPFHDMYVFAIGVMTYYALKQGREKLMYIFLAGFFALGIALNKGHYLWIVFASLYIILSEKIERPKEMGDHNNDMPKAGVLRSLIVTLSKYSFAIYLSHLFAFSLADEIAAIIGLDNGEFLWILTAIIITAFLSIVYVNIFGKIRIRTGNEN